MSISAERLRSALDYDANTGVFQWRAGAFARVRPGKVAGCTNPVTGYRQIRIDNAGYLAHRLAWLLVTGEWPAGDIDHIDSNRENNAFRNLRCVSPRTNSENMRRATKRSTTGLLGVVHDRKRRGFKATICTNGRRIHIGTFSTPDAAHAAYVERKRAIHQGCTI